MSQGNEIITVNPNATVYNGTTQPSEVPKRRNKSDLGPDFVAPDGGWGWIVCIAAGLSTLLISPALEQGYAMFIRHLRNMDIWLGHIRLLLILEYAPMILLGLMNGAVFYRFSFRQVAVTGGVFAVVGITFIPFCETFATHAISFALYGIGFGLNTLATTIAVYTYFKKHRRIATGLVWTIIGFGPLIVPVDNLNQFFNSQGPQVTILIFAVVAFGSIVCGFALKPVSSHENFKEVKRNNRIDINLQEKKTEEDFEELNSLDRSKTEQQNEPIQEYRPKMTCQKLFGLDFLCDLTFMNLVQAIVFTKFGKISFASSAASILIRHGFSSAKFKLAMALLGGVDIVMRFLAPFLLERVRIGNSVLFAFGLIITIIGRFLLTKIYSHYILVALFAMVGVGNAFCTVFGQLIIPSYVPLQRLPAALGLQMTCETLLWVFFYQSLSIMDDPFDYGVEINFFNILSMLSLLLWAVEWIVRRKLGKPRSHTQQD